MRLLDVTFAESSGLDSPLAVAFGAIDLDEVATARELLHSQQVDGFPDSVPGILVAMKGWGGSYFILTSWPDFRAAWRGYVDDAALETVPTSVEQPVLPCDPQILCLVDEDAPLYRVQDAATKSCPPFIIGTEAECLDWLDENHARWTGLPPAPITLAQVAS